MPAIPSPTGTASAASPASCTYAPLSAPLFAPLAHHDQIGTHGFVISGNAFNSAQLIKGWNALVDLWPVLAAKLVRGDQLPSSAAAAPSASLGSSGRGNKNLYLQIPDAATLQAERAAHGATTATASNGVQASNGGGAAAGVQTSAPSASAPAAGIKKPRSAPGPPPSLMRKLFPCFDTSSSIQEDDVPHGQNPKEPSDTPPSGPPRSTSLLIVSARKGLSIREALPFRRPEELPAQSISTFPSIDDKIILDGDYARNAPRSISELLQASSKKNVVNGQVTLFEDGMLVVLSAPVAFLDARGALEVISAWTGIMSSVSTNPQLLPAPLPNFSTTGTGAGVKTGLEQAASSAMAMSATARALLPTPYGWFKYTRWESFLFRLRAILGSCKATFQSGSGLEARELWIPKEVVDALMSQARMDLQREGHEVDGEEGRVAVDHVLLAWLVQSISKAQGSSRTPLSILVPKDLRLVNAEDGKPFVPSPFIGGNGSLPTVPLSEIPHSTVQASRLGVLALRIRYAQESQTAPEAATNTIQWQVANDPSGISEDGNGNTHGVQFHSPNGDPMIFDDLHASAAASAPPPRGTNVATAPITSQQLVPVDFFSCLVNASETAGKPTVTKFKLPLASAASPPAPVNGELLHTFSFIDRPSLRKRECGVFSLPTPVPGLQMSRNADGGAATGPTTTAVLKGYTCGGQLEKKAWRQKSGLGAGEAVRF